MPYLTTIKRPTEPIVLVNEDLNKIKGLNTVAFSGYSTGSDVGTTTDRDAPRSMTGYAGSGIDTTIPKGSGPDLGRTDLPRGGSGAVENPAFPSLSRTLTGYSSVGDIPKQGDILPGGSTITLPNGLTVTIPRINGPENPAYITGYTPPVIGGDGNAGGGGGGGSTGTPDKNGFVWTLPNGQGFPPTRILLFSNNRRTYYYEDKDLTTKFQAYGKTLDQCSRASNEAVGVFTGNYKFNTVDPFGKGYTLKSFEVKTKFPFDRTGNPVETEYTLWVDTFVRYFTDNVVSVTTNSDGTQTLTYADGTTSVVSQNFTPITGGTGGYNTGGNTTTDTPAAKSNTGIFLIAGLGLLLLSSKSK